MEDQRPFAGLFQDDAGNFLLDAIRAILRPLSQVTGGGSNRLSVDVNAVTTCSNVANQTNLGGVAAFELQKAASHNTFAASVMPALI